MLSVALAQQMGLIIKSAALSALPPSRLVPLLSVFKPRFTGLLFSIPLISHHHSRVLPERDRWQPERKTRPRARSALVDGRKLLANGAGLTRPCGDRLARLDHGGVRRTVGDARGKANADDQHREDERHCHHLHG